MITTSPDIAALEEELLAATSSYGPSSEGMKMVRVLGKVLLHQAELLNQINTRLIKLEEAVDASRGQEVREDAVEGPSAAGSIRRTRGVGRSR